jgi:hypothetical protein
MEILDNVAAQIRIFLISGQWLENGALPSTITSIMRFDAHVLHEKS